MKKIISKLNFMIITIVLLYSAEVQFLQTQALQLLDTTFHEIRKHDDRNNMSLERKRVATGGSFMEEMLDINDSGHINENQKKEKRQIRARAAHKRHSFLARDTTKNEKKIESKSNSEKYLQKLSHGFAQEILSKLELRQKSSNFMEKLSRNQKDGAKLLKGTLLSIKNLVKAAVDKYSAEILPRIESHIASGLKPPAIAKQEYDNNIKPLISSLFNQIEDELDTQVSDKIWD